MSKIKIWYFSPGCGKKELGQRLNQHCELVPDGEDWICIRDNDVAFLTPHINKQIEDIVEKHGKDFHLFSCVTNRLGLSHQMPYGLMAETNILNLREISEHHFNNHYDEVENSISPTAGLFMLFQKKTWKNNNFIDGICENGLFVDHQFSSRILRNGGKIGICKGIFAFHYYRLHQKNPLEHQHLKNV